MTGARLAAVLLVCGVARSALAVDLVVTSIAANPASIPRGSSITVTDTVMAAGGSSGQGFAIYYYLSTDSTITSADTKIGSRTVSTLAADQSSTATTAFPLPTSLTGPFYVGEIVDAAGVVAESDETNNAVAGNSVEIIKPDLSVSSLSVSPATIPLGGSLTVTDTVTTTGASTGGGFTINYYLSADSTITTADTKLGSRTVSTMAAGSSSTATPTFSPPTSLTGPYYVGVIVDAAGAIAESDETNNAVAGNTVEITKPDLTVTSLSVSPASIPLGGSITVADTVTANGGNTVSGFTVDYYLSTDSSISTADKYIGRRSVSALKVGQSSSATTTIAPPTSLTGTYYIGAIVDGTGAVAESDETNNSLAGNTVEITKPDLTVTSVSVSPASIPLGGSITVTDTVSVTGGTPLQSNIGVDYYLSPDPTITTADTRIGSRSVWQLKTGQSNSATSTFAPPTSLTGTYYIGAIVDPTNGVPESDETNNSLAGNTVVITKPDLTVTSVSVSPASIPLGGSIIVTDTVSVTGGTPLQSNIGVDYYLSRDPTITTADTRIGSRSVWQLKSGQSSSATSTFAPPTSLTGTYYIGAIVDPTNGVPESEETNNSLAGNTVVITKPDLTVTSLSVSPATSPLGSPISIKDTVRASGGSSLSSFTVQYYLSTDANITVADTRVASRNVNALAAGVSSSATTTVTPPTSLTGRYYIGAIVDSTGTVDESDEANNVVAGNTVEITKPDLVLASFSASSTIVTAKVNSFTVTDTVKNLGGQMLTNSYVYYYLSTDAVITSGDTMIGGRYLSSVAPGASSTATTTLSAPATLPGTYYLGAIVDPTGTIPESNEANNTILWRRIEVVADTAPPVITLTGAWDGMFTNELPHEVCYSVTDAQLVSAEGALDGVPFTGCAMAYLAGSHLLTVTTTDTAGNSVTQHAGFVIDVTMPVVLVNTPADGATIGAVAVPVALSGSDDSGLAGVQVNGVSLQLAGDGLYHGSVVLDAEGPNALTFAATDLAGNVAQMTEQVTRDTVAPVLTVTEPVDGATVADQVAVSGSVSDTSAVTVRVDGIVASVDASGAFSLSVPIQPGQQSITAVATDLGGNVASVTRAVFDGASTRFCYDGAGNVVGHTSAGSQLPCGAQ